MKNTAMASISGESKAANIGISLPGTGEQPAAPVFIDGKKAMTLRGPNIAAEFKTIVEGYIAKRFNSKTELGAYLDPMADKLLIVSIYVALGVAGELPSWLVIAVVSRDILIVLGVLLCWIIGRPVEIQPHLVSKANTASQLLLAALVLADEGFGLNLDGLRIVLIGVTAVLTASSLAVYVRAWVVHVAGGDR